MSKEHRSVGVTLVEAVFITVMLLVVGLAVWELSAMHSKQKHQAMVRAENTKRQTETALKSICIGLVGIDAANCLNKAVEAADKAASIERAKDDLSAQEAMSEWAFWMMIASFGGVAATVVGIFYVWRTLVATQQMAIDQRRIGEAQVRAYLSFEVENVGITSALDIYRDGRWLSGPAEITIEGRIFNSGQSPARRTSCSYSIETAQIGASSTADARFLRSKTHPSATIINSGKDTHQTFKMALNVDWGELVAEKQVVSFMLSINYEDVFREKVNTPLVAGHVMGIANLIHDRADGGKAAANSGLRFVWDQILEERTYEYED